MSRHFCPMCGYNLEPDPVVERDGWRIDPRGDVRFKDRIVKIPASWVGILHAVGSTTECVSRDALLNRISGSENSNVLCAQISKFRRFCKEFNLPVPFETVWGRGLRWAAA